jgi:hypothetical protein
MEKLTIGQVLPILRDTYRSIDIRAILLKPKEKPNSDDWVCVFIKIRLTKETQTDLEKIHAKMGSIENKFYKVILTSINIRQIDALINEIRNGNITLKGIRCNILGKDCRGILTKTIVRSEAYTTSEERAGFFHGIFFISTDDGSIYSLIRSLSERDFGMEFQLMSSQLNTREDEVFANTNNVIIIFPLYCRHRNPSRNEVDAILAKYEIHELLVPKCNATIERSKCNAMTETNSTTDVKQLKFTDCKSQKSDEMVEVQLPMVFPSISPDDWIEFEIRHDNLGIIGQSKIEADDILQPPYGLDPLWDGFYLFKAKENISEYIKSKVEQPQALSTSWLLTLLGFRCIYLGKWKKYDENITTICHYQYQAVCRCCFHFFTYKILT